MTSRYEDPPNRRIGAAILVFAGGSAACVLLLHLLTGSLTAPFYGSATNPEYGFVMFCGIPFILGVFAAIARALAGYHGVSASLIAVIAILVLTGFMILFTGAEGVICLVMAFPIVFVIALFGAALTTAICRASGFPRGPAAGAFSVVALLLPLQGVEGKLDVPEPVYEVTTSVHVDAPPPVVWSKLVAFSEIPPPEEWIFKSGVAYPIRARIEGEGVGAVRYCEFTTGAFVEPIEMWDEPRRLAFSVTENPPAMEEMSPYKSLEPPHVMGYLEAERGQFVLHELADGTTQLEGTTWYRHGLRPASYWRLWSDVIIHTIHRRVLEHIKAEAERDRAG